MYMEQNVQERLDAMEVKIDTTLKAVKKIQWYMTVTAWVTIAVIVLPMLGLLFAIPALLSSYTEAMNLIQY